MTANSAPAASLRHPAESELLAQAAQGDIAAAERVLSQLGSANPWLRQIMVEGIAASADPRLWQRLLHCLALHRWGETTDSRRRLERDVSERIDDAIVDLFVNDLDPAGVPVKRAVLEHGLPDPECRIRTTAACLLGLRGDRRAIPFLVEAMRAGERECKRRAMTALGGLGDERGAWALVEALSLEDEVLHWEVVQALHRMGAKALPALAEALRHPEAHVRWHAVRALASIGDERAAGALAPALADPDYGVRWAAADGLAQLGETAVPAILDALARQAMAGSMREAALHSLHQLPSDVQARLGPLLEVLRGPTTAGQAPAVALRLRQTWERRD